MTATIQPITPGFAAEVGDVDVSQPLTAKNRETILDAFATYAVLVFPDQKLTPEQHLAFAELFGPIEPATSLVRGGQDKRLRRELADVSNLKADNDVWDKDSRMRFFQLANRLWHTDSSFKYLPAKASLLYARSIPPIGGWTEFADERAAYDGLTPAKQRQLDGLVAEHCIRYSRMALGFDDFSEEEKAKQPPVPQMLVRTLAETGRKSLYLASHAGHIYGMPDAEAKALLADLIAHATDRRYVYSHRYRVNDLVVWDNRCTMHRGTVFDDLRWPRDIQRATVSDTTNTVIQAGRPLPKSAAA